MSMMDIYDELRELIKALDARGVEYALCGGLAMAVHAVPRATIDIDIMIEAESLDVAREIAASLGYTIDAGPMKLAKGAVELRRVSKIDPESKDLLSLDLLLVTEHVAGVWRSREKVEWEGGMLSVVSREGLVTLKELRGSGTDMDDIKRLKRHLP